MGPCIEVAVEAPIGTTLSYSAEGFSDLKIGQSVKVPLGKRVVHGVITDVSKPTQTDLKIKNVLELEDDRPHLSKTHLEWFEWIARYYQYPIGEVVKLAFPPTKKSTKKLDSTDVILDDSQNAKPIARELTVEQKTVLQNISLESGFGVHLVHGVTGSGKTEIYIQLLKSVLEKGLQGLVLVPEISLTPQLVKRFSERFPNQVAVIHSHLTNRQKTDAWWEMIDNKKSILIGARSALFCPVKKWGAIIIDEEHEGSFKQDEKLKYHARDAAIVLASKQKIPVILGSATPSLETWYNCKEGRYKLHTLKERVLARPLPTIETIDLKTEKDNAVTTKVDLPYWLSSSLYNEIKLTLEQKEQVALFLNRRGVSSQVLCRACGFVEECPNCSVALTLHGKNHLVCHYCQYEKRMNLNCPSCKDAELTSIGLGTEQVEQDLKNLFPIANVDRADRDEIKNRAELEAMINNMESGKTDILVGTQMIAKGLDFEKLTLVGLVMADIGFYMPDFRASERSFQLITQVSGRSGRHSKNPGKVFIQTYNPNHPSITYAMAHDFYGFIEHELDLRRQFQFPPFVRLSLVRIQGINQLEVERAADYVASTAKRISSQSPTPVEVLGPSPAPLFKVRNQYRYHVLLKHSDIRYMTSFHEALMSAQQQKTNRVKIILDVEPLSML